MTDEKPLQPAYGVDMGTDDDDDPLYEWEVEGRQFVVYADDRVAIRRGLLLEAVKIPGIVKAFKSVASQPRPGEEFLQSVIRRQESALRLARAERDMVRNLEGELLARIRVLEASARAADDWIARLEGLREAPVREELLTADQAAPLLGMTAGALRRAATRGTAPVAPVRLGRRLRWRRGDLIDCGRAGPSRGVSEVSP